MRRDASKIDAATAAVAAMSMRELGESIDRLKDMTRTGTKLPQFGEVYERVGTGQRVMAIGGDPYASRAVDLKTGEMFVFNPALWAKT